MNANGIRTAVILGSGNVATWFAFALKNANLQVLQVFSKTAANCQRLAESCAAEAITDIARLRHDADIYIFSVKDDAYAELVNSVNFTMPLAAITAGSVSQDVLRSKSECYGVIYPCQTISKNLDFLRLEVPLCVEGCDEATTETLTSFAQQLNDKVYHLNGEQRQQLHLAAVFASNFSNAMYGIGMDVLQKNGIDKELIFPLLQNTLDKAKVASPWDCQTGPARRNDHQVMTKHIDLLKDSDLEEIYRSISQLIIKRTK